MTDRRGMQLADYIRELTEPHTHAEHYDLSDRDVDGNPIPRKGPPGRRHATRVPSLMTQLWDNDTPSASAEEGPRPGFRSKPAARLDALDAAVRIDLQSSRWLRDLGEDDPLDTVGCIRRLHGLLRSMEMVTRREVERDVRRWWLQARIVTGWDSPAWTPDSTCPQCGERGTLRVRLTERIGMCTNDACRSTWEEATIWLLADHIRDESAERRPRVLPGPCWCPWPMPVVGDLSRLCPRCGSARCTHALRSRLLDTLRGQRGA